MSVKNLLLLDWGLCTSFSGIVIPALTGFSNEQNHDELLVMTSTQASWIGNFLEAIWVNYLFIFLVLVFSASIDILA